MSSPGCGPVFKYLVEKHEELDTISLMNLNMNLQRERSTEDEKDIMLTLFSNINLRSVTLHNIWYTEDIVGCLPSTLPNLEKLVLTDWWSLSDQGLIKILIRSENIEN